MDSIFSANAPSLGYLYQIRYGLMLIISEEDQSSKLYIEKIDDVSIQTPLSLDVYQTKLHINSVANLTNASPDLWKTLRVWSEGIKSGLLNPTICIFNLITTAIAPDGTIPFKLKSNMKAKADFDEILDALSIVANTSNNLSNKAAYESFLSLSDMQRQQLIRRITVVDASIDINTAKTKILHELRHSAVKKESLFERLEGWFLGQVILQLQGQRDSISAHEVTERILSISDQLKADNLPNDFNESLAGEEQIQNSYKNKTFVKQIELIDANLRTINHAISDYHRAFSQMSKWIREGLVNPMDQINYHKKLEDDWDRKFSIVSDSVNKDSDSQKIAGKVFYDTHYVNTHPKIYIRDRFTEQYMVVGCCHMLSDRKTIGWHPDFKNII